jgi:methylenetetrahydrofolate dehydrogenase (NADP+)/methenyltetrahydrofolate cyclohydrolase
MADYPIVFDGKEYARKEEKELGDKLFDIKKRGVEFYPKLAVMLIGDNEASKLYVKMKKEACERVGVRFELFSVPTIQRDSNYIIQLIRAINADPTIHGLLVQLPLPEKYKKDKDRILSAIAPEKDVDGLTENSPFLPATAQAVMTIVSLAEKQVQLPEKPTAFVVGSKGMVGKAVMKAFKERGIEVDGFDIEDYQYKLTKVSVNLTSTADILVTATGTPFLIRNRHVKPHAIVIDVGSPKGDVEFEGASKRADFITPVPGGVGPVTVLSLIQNVVKAASTQENLTI